MAKHTQTTYEALLADYLEIKGKVDSKNREATTEIAAAKERIADASAKMDKAIDQGNKSEYVRLAAIKAESEATIDFYDGVLSKAKATPVISTAEANEATAKADAEIRRIADDYNAEIVKLMAPILELSQRTYEQIHLLAIAKDSYRKKLLFDSTIQFHMPFEDTPVMQFIDKFVQCGEFKKICPDTRNILPYEKYEWLKPAEVRVHNESLKWD